MAFKKIPSKYRKIVLAFWIIVATPIVISSLFVIAAATEILGDLPSFEELENANPNYKHFKAVQNKNVYSFSSKKGKTGGVIYYELASNRPDLVLKDLIKILHPELMEEYELYFFEKLK